MANDVLRVEREGAVAIMTLNRPAQVNALNAELRAALRQAIAELETDSAIRVAILKGEGRGFCAGADLTGGMTHPISDEIEREYKPVLVGIADTRLIWIAQVHGPAAGIGAALAMNCDLMTMAEDAFIYMAFAAIALVPDGGNTWLLLRKMGYARAMQTILEGRRVPASECLQLGIANKVLPASQLDAATRQWAAQLAAAAPMAMVAAKRMLRAGDAMSYAQAITAEAIEQDPLVASSDFAEGVAAFFAKRKPLFQGK